jgi:hypothetical protein
MNCVKADLVADSISESISSLQLVEELDNGLHAMAQPLTVLRGVFGALKMRGAVGPEHARYLDMSEEQIQRLCQLMSGLRCLLDVAQNDATREAVDLWDMVIALIEEQEPTLNGTGVRIAAMEPEQPLMVMGDQGRTEHALRAALITAVRIASQDDVIHLEAVPGDSFVDLRVQNSKAHSKGISSANRLNLALAQANTLSQQGIFECSADPFFVSIKLPLYAERDEAKSENVFSTLCEAC